MHECIGVKSVCNAQWMLRGVSNGRLWPSVPTRMVQHNKNIGREASSNVSVIVLAQKSHAPFGSIGHDLTRTASRIR